MTGSTMVNAVQRTSYQRGRRVEAPDTSASSSSIRQKKAIVIIDKRILFRDCLARCIGTADANHIVLAFGSVAEWIELAPDYPPAGVIVFCTQGPSHSCTEPARDLALLSRAHPEVPFVLVSDGDDVDDVLGALESGARGYIPTSVSLEVAVGAMYVVEAGGTFVPATSLVASRRTPEVAPGQNGHHYRMFTARQAAVLEALRRGKPNKQIAYDLNMRESTVKLHVRNIMRKLKAKNRTEAALLSSSLVEGLSHR
jgi:DNA-binding NarL/FixJ family response regulator